MSVELFTWKGFKLPKVVYRLLGKHQAHGQATPKLIEIDSRLKGKKLLEILVHEGVHAYNFNMEEEEVIKLSRFMTDLLWREGWRKVDNKE